MTDLEQIAREVVDKYNERQKTVSHLHYRDERPVMENLIVQALATVQRETRAKDAAIARSLYDKTYWDDPSAGIAVAIEAQGE